MLDTVLERRKECGAVGCPQHFSSADNHRYCVKHDKCVYDGVFGQENCGECGQLVEVVLSGVEPPDMLTLVARELLTQRWIQATRYFTHLTWCNQHLPHRLNISQTHKEWEQSTGPSNNDLERRGREQEREEARREGGKHYSAIDRLPNHSSHESNFRSDYDEYYNQPHKDHKDQRDHRDTLEGHSDEYKRRSSPDERRSPLTQYSDGTGDPLKKHNRRGRSPSPPPAPSFKIPATSSNTSTTANFGVGITSTLLKILAEQRVGSEAEANIAADIITLLMNALSDYNERQRSPSSLFILNRIAADVLMLKNKSITKTSSKSSMGDYIDQVFSDSKSSATSTLTTMRPPGKVFPTSPPLAHLHQQQPFPALPNHRASYQGSLPPSAAGEYGAMGSGMRGFMESKRQNLTPQQPQIMPYPPYNNNMNNMPPGYNYPYPPAGPAFQASPFVQPHQYHNF